MNKNECLFSICFIASIVQSQDETMNFIGHKRVCENLVQTVRKQHRLGSLEEELILHLHNENSSGVLDIIDYIVGKGLFTPELGHKINQSIDSQVSLSYVPEVFIPVKQRIDYLVKSYERWPLLLDEDYITDSTSVSTLSNEDALMGYQMNESVDWYEFD